MGRRPARENSRLLIALLAGGALLAASPKGVPFKGHYGYSLLVPQGFSVLSGFTDEQGVQERVQVYPSELDPGSAAFAEELLLNGGALLDVVPKWFVEQDQGVRSLEEYALLVRKNAGGKLKRRELSSGKLRGLEFSFESPDFPTTIILEGRKVFYRGSSRNPRLLKRLMLSLREK